MKISIILGAAEFAGNHDFRQMCSSLSDNGHILETFDGPVPPDGTQMLMCVGGDGTFLKTSQIAVRYGLPVVGVNLGRLGFLSENTPSSVAEALVSGRYTVRERSVLSVTVQDKEMLALNEVCIHRGNGPMLGVQVSVDDNVFPVYWADGLIVATPSGSTAYSLSAGGPIVMPSSRVVIIAPIAPHNLNVRPVIVPDGSSVALKFISRSAEVNLSADNSYETIPTDSTVTIKVAQFSLKRVCLDNSNFVKALSEKLFWGEDKRNENDR